MFKLNVNSVQDVIFFLIGVYIWSMESGMGRGLF